MNHQEMLSKLWHELYDPKTNVKLCVEKWFHPEFKETMNGVVRSRDEYISHISKQKLDLVLERIDFKEHMDKDDQFFEIYRVHAHDLHHHPIEAEVIAFFQLKGSQIFSIHGQMHMIKGSLHSVHIKN